MSNHSCRVSHLVRLEELNECLQWVLAHYSMERASWIVNRLTSHVRNGGASGIFVSAASMVDGAVPPTGPICVDRQKLFGVAIAIRQPGNSATLLALQMVGDAMASEVLTPLAERLSQTGATFIQSGCDDDSQAGMLAEGGFEPLANLVMMSLEADQFETAAELATGTPSMPQLPPEPIEWFNMEQLGEDWRPLLNEAATRTFIDTQDCPRLSDFRSADEIVEGYVTATHFDRRLASLMRVGGDWAGCLILTGHAALEDADLAAADSQTEGAESGAIELTYMGLVPEFRGKGLSGQLMLKTIGHAKTVGASRIVLAVDRDNRPAAAIYQRLGWRDVIGETVWGRKI